VRVNLNMPTGTTLLLIDEDGDRRSMFKQLLREGGYSIAAAVNDVAKLGDAVRQHKPDAIVVSTGQPSRRLLEQIDELKDADRLPVVLFSEDDRSETMQRAIAAGVNAYIVLGLSSNRVRTAVDLAFINFTQTETLRGKVAEAEKCYREDLEIHPGNGWALHGLSECLERRKATADAAEVKKQFDVAWANATVQIKASCFCRRFQN